MNNEIQYNVNIQNRLQNQISKQKAMTCTSHTRRDMQQPHAKRRNNHTRRDMQQPHAERRNNHTRRDATTTRGETQQPHAERRNSHTRRDATTPRGETQQPHAERRNNHTRRVTQARMDMRTYAVHQKQHATTQQYSNTTTQHTCPVFASVG